MVLAHMQRLGMRPIVVVGGATGMIGDPSGRSGERNLLTRGDVAANASALKQQLTRFLRFEGEHAAIMVDNHDWLSSKSHLEWLRDVGKHFTINYMLSKESVRRRLEDREGGISYTEFSYMLLQAYDFLHLCETLNCHFQGGGSDQWGNITAGIELIRRVRGDEACGITFPLVTSSAGEKFGKSEGNAIWLDAAMTTPFEFYQYWINVDDRDARKFLAFFTFMSLEEIAEICVAHEIDPERRMAQRRLAAEVTRLAHGDEELRRAETASAALFGDVSLNDLCAEDLAAALGHLPSVTVALSRLDGDLSCADALVAVGAAKSKGEARRLLQGGGAYLNGARIRQDREVQSTDLLPGKLLVLRAGKRNQFLLRFE